MKLTMHPRKGSSKASLRQLRFDSKLPAILYSHKNGSQMISVEGDEFQAILRGVEKGCLSTKQFRLVGEGGKEVTALLKEIQYHPTTYAILHLDFEELFAETPVNVKIPVQCVGVADCVGIKLGGVLRQVIRHLRVRCLPAHIPEKFQLDVRELNVLQTKALKEIELPKEVTPLVNLNEVAVVIAKR